jgi:hypothetical protein
MNMVCWQKAAAQQGVLEKGVRSMLVRMQRCGEGEARGGSLVARVEAL